MNYNPLDISIILLHKHHSILQNIFTLDYLYDKGIKLEWYTTYSSNLNRIDKYSSVLKRVRECKSNYRMN